ncbi:class I SAM-dependent rRNA methyltransferase [Alkalicoccus luteus]|uniref:class I SAM-dependent rRNA methyltransferase n=1 Tax=Alkalicoccus luteus TaxID=1237094 RepID=UPI0040342A4C
MEERRLTALPETVEQYQAGFPLLTEEAVGNRTDLEEGELFTLEAPDGDFLGRGYIGKQNKGIGWILTKKENEQIDEQFISKKLMMAISRRGNLLASEETTAFRVFNGEGDGFGGILIDYYAGYYVLQFYSQGAYSFRQQFIDILTQTMDPAGIYEKKRFSDDQEKQQSDFVSGNEAPAPLPIKENGMNFAVYLDDGAMTGIFLDQRDVRKTLRDEWAAGSTVLNTFSYTGAFSTAAALGGAVSTVSVDAANRSREKTAEQFRLNEIDMDSQTILVDDVFSWFRKAASRQQTYDIVVLDPPSFARTKQTMFRAAKDYGRLVEDALELMEPGSLLIASTNHAGLPRWRFRRQVEQAFKAKDRRFRMEKQFSLPEDFLVNADYPEGDYLKVLAMRVL